MKTNTRDQWRVFVNSMNFIAKATPPGKIIEHRNSEGKLHNTEGPAYISHTTQIGYLDGKRHGAAYDVYGSKTFYYNGTRVPEKYIKNPKDLTLKEILSHINTEVRRAGLEIYGMDNIYKNKECKIIDTDNEQALIEIDSYPARFVRVINSTPEPDGSYKIYFLCVPPDMKKVKEAVSWTFRKDPDNYHPNIET